MFRILFGALLIVLVVSLIVIAFPKYDVGDINKDGDIDMQDLDILAMYLEGRYDVHRSDRYLLDFNGDGVVDRRDLLDLHSFLMGHD